MSKFSSPRLKWGEVAWATVLKLAALPPLVWGACLLLNLSSLETGVAVMTAALTTGANAAFSSPFFTVF